MDARRRTRVDVTPVDGTLPFAGRCRADAHGACGRGGGSGSRGVGERTGGRQPRHVAGGESHRLRTRPPGGYVAAAAVAGEGGRDRAPRTRPHLRPRETRLRGQGRRIFVHDVPAHEAAAAGEERARAAGREAARLLTVGTSPSGSGGRANGRGARCRGGGRGARASRKGVGAAGRGSCCGMGSRETSPSANKARARPPRQLPRPDLAASIARRGGAGPQPLPQPSSGPTWCRGGISSWS